MNQDSKTDDANEILFLTLEAPLINFDSPDTDIKVSQLLEGTTIKSHTVNIKIILLLGCIAISKDWLQLNYFSLIFFFFFFVDTF